ncbi:hypothetical protein CIG19_13655 [Enterobacterales bacterium CwR94]|nr:hypothetical protein CIG19_13655 [Enterobacterales bacterium CwR94]
MKFALTTLALIAGMSAVSANAAALNEKNLSLEDANALATAAIQSCAANKYNVSVTVVDRAGNIKALQRMDNAGPHTIEASRMKAFTSLSTKNASGKVMEAAQNNAGAANMKDVPGFLLLAGGLPVRDGDQVIGAVGIGGAPGGHLDEQCAQAAIDTVFKK